MVAAVLAPVIGASRRGQAFGHRCVSRPRKVVVEFFSATRGLVLFLHPVLRGAADLNKLSAVLGTRARTDALQGRCIAEPDLQRRVARAAEGPTRGRLTRRACSTTRVRERAAAAGRCA